MGHESQANDASAPTHGSGDQAALEAENASLQDRLLRALADAENTRRRAAQSAPRPSAGTPSPMLWWKCYRYWTTCNVRVLRQANRWSNRSVARPSLRGG